MRRGRGILRGSRPPVPDRGARGPTVQVTNAGRIAAVISPPAASALYELEARGALRPARRPVSDLKQLKRRTAARGSAELLADGRGRW